MCYLSLHFISYAIGIVLPAYFPFHVLFSAPCQVGKRRFPFYMGWGQHEVHSMFKQVRCDGDLRAIWEWALGAQLFNRLAYFHSECQHGQFMGWRCY